MELQWPLILFTTFMAWSMGLFATAGIAQLLGQGKKTQMPALITSVVLMAIGGISVFFHLQHWERIFNGFGHITSGITQELIGIVLVAVVMVLYFIQLRKSEDGGTVAKWAAILAIVVTVATDIVMAHSYMMASRPAWDSVFQIGSIVGASCALGPLTFVFMMCLRGDEVKGETKTDMALVSVVGTAACAVLVAVYAAVISTCSGAYSSFTYYWDPTNPMEKMANVAGDVVANAPLLWVGAVVIGAIAPFVCAFFAWKKGDEKLWKTLALVGMVLAVAGAIILRMVFYNMGICFFTAF